MEKSEQDGSTRSSGSSCVLTCCLCKCFLLEGSAWLLPCLHNACRPCLEQAATKDQQQQGDCYDGDQRVSCPVCRHVADVKSATRNDLVNRQIRRQNGLAEATVCCDACQENDVVDKPATMWCRSCTKSLCTDCGPAHDRYYKKHATEPLVLQTSSCHPRAPNFRCSSHGATCDFVCLTCQSPKCIDCWSDCAAGRHDMRRLTDGSIATLVEKAKQNLAHLERGLRSRTLILDRRQNLLHELRAAREEQLSALKTRKQRVVDAVDGAYAAAEKALKDLYDELEAKAARMERDAVSLDLQVRQAIEYCRYVAGVDASACDLMLDQQRKVSSRIESLLADVNGLLPPLGTAELVSFDSSLPEDLRAIMAAWIGVPMSNSDDLCRVKNVPQGRGRDASGDLGAAGCRLQETLLPPAAERQLQQLNSIADRVRLTTLPPPVTKGQLVSAASAPCLLPPPSTEGQPLLFGPASSSFQMSINCCLDIALTQDGYILVAARDQGLREYSLRGLELRCWLPTALGIACGHVGDGCCDCHDAADEVRTVEALTGGRAAVGLYHFRLIVVLRRSTAGDAWLEERRLAVLQSSPNRMSACGDLIAVAGCSSCCGAGTGEERLEVVSLSSDEPRLYARRAEYSLLSVAVTASAVFTTSDGVVALGDGRQACVVDCYGHRSGQRLWRYVAGDSEEVWDVCLGTAGNDAASVAGVLVYLGVRRWDDGGESRVAAVRASDGKQLKDDVLGSGDGKQRCGDSAPRCLFRLSVAQADRRTVLAVLNWVNKTVTVYPAAGGTVGSSGDCTSCIKDPLQGDGNAWQR